MPELDYIMVGKRVRVTKLTSPNFGREGLVVFTVPVDSSVNAESFTGKLTMVHLEYEEHPIGFAMESLEVIES